MNAVSPRRQADRAFVPAASSPPAVSPVPASIPRGGLLRLALFEQTKVDIRQRYAAINQKLASDMQGELDEATRRYWAGEDFA